jgi:hypothetical protein
MSFVFFLLYDSSQVVLVHKQCLLRSNRHSSW